MISVRAALTSPWQPSELTVRKQVCVWVRVGVHACVCSVSMCVLCLRVCVGVREGYVSRLMCV